MESKHRDFFRGSTEAKLTKQIDSQQLNNWLLHACDGCKGCFFYKMGGVWLSSNQFWKGEGKNNRILNSQLDLSEPRYVIRAISAWLLIGPQKLAILLAN